MPFFNLYNEDNPYHFKTNEELIKLLKENGITKGKTIATYCGTGIWSSVIYVVAKHLGYEVKFYDASFEEWSADDKLPVTDPVTFN